MDQTLPIVALDFSNLEETLQFLRKFEEERLFVKVGMELYYQYGPRCVQEIQELGHHIFLDLKIHDIPNTAYRAMKGLAQLQVDMVNVHAAGGCEMMKAAMNGLIDGTPSQALRPKLIAVTQLTSTNEKSMQADQGLTLKLEESVLLYACKTKEAGLDGVVCSAWEATSIIQQTASNFLTVTPGIRPKMSIQDDQKRVASPQDAKRLGASYIVVGRPITQAKNPLEAYQSILAEWKGADVHETK